LKRSLLWSAVALVVALCLLLLDDEEGEREGLDLRLPGSGPVEERVVVGELAAPERTPSPTTGPREELSAVAPLEGPGDELTEGDLEFLEMEIEMELPPDPVERGDCALLLELIDRETRDYVESHVDLWRLGAPGNEHWTEGDQLQTSVHVREGGATVRQLPEGIYRARVRAEVRHADDPPEFAVRGPHTQVLLEVELPRSHPAYLRVYDEHGIEILEAECSIGVASDYQYGPDDVPWRRERRLKNDSGEWLFDSEISSFADSPFGSTPLQAGREGFYLGDFRQASREGLLRQRITLLAPHRSSVHLEVDGAPGEPQHFVGVAVDLAHVIDSIFRPDGSKDPALVKRLEARCEAQRVSEPDPSESWRELPIEVTVAKNETFQELKFTFRARDLPLGDRFLVER